MRYFEPYSYLETLAEKYPTLQVSTIGDGTDYDSLVCHNAPLPSKAELDAAKLELTKLRGWYAIKNERDRRQAGGVLVGHYWFHSDGVSRIQQLALVMLQSSIPPGLLWKTMSGELVPMTPTLAVQIFQCAVLSDTKIFAIAEQHKVNMYAAEDPSQYDFLSGWPLIYEETV
jgi:hypothetical protein